MVQHKIKENIRDLLKLAVPVSIGQLGHIMLGVVDSFMVGEIGTDSLAAAGLANGLFFLIMVIGIGISHALTTLVAIAVGEGKVEKCREILAQSIIVHGVFAILLSLITYVLAKLVYHLGQDPIVAELTESYLTILSFSILPFMLFQTYRQFVEGLSDTKTPMYMALAANIVNIFANWVLIFGNLGLPALGLEGAGLATLSTRIFLGFGMMYIVVSSNKYKQFNPTLRIFKPDLKLIKKIISIGLPSGLTYSLEVSAFAFAAILVGWLGSVPLAAHQIGINLASISYMIVLGISAAATIKVGNAYGAKSEIDLKYAGYTALFLGFIFMLFSGLFFISFNKFLPSLYINDKNVISVASSLLIVAALFQLSDGLQAVGLGVLKGMTDLKIPMLIVFFAYWLIGLPIGYILAFHYEMNVVGIWVGLLIGLSIVAVLLFFRFKNLVKKKL